MSALTLAPVNNETDGSGRLTIGIIATVVFCFGLVFSLIGVVEWSDGASFTGPFRELAWPVINGPIQIIRPYQCHELYYVANGRRHVPIPASPRDWVWGLKLAVAGSWYLYGACLTIRTLIAVGIAPFRPSSWKKADQAIGIRLAIWLTCGLIIAIIAGLLTNRQDSQC